MITENNNELRIKNAEIRGAGKRSKEYARILKLPVQIAILNESAHMTASCRQTFTALQDVVILI